MQRRTIGVLIALVGVTFLVTVFGDRLFTASSAFERLSDDVRPTMTAEGVQTLRQDVQGLEAVGTEFGEKVLPVLAQALQLTPEQLTQRFAGDFPAIARGALSIPQIVGDLNGRIDLLDAQRGNFAQADAIPTATRSSTGVPWFILLTGIAALVLGAAVIRPGRVGPALAVLLGAVMLVAPLATTLVSKSADADRLNTAFRPVFTQATVASQQEALGIVQAMAAEMQEGMIPALAEQLRLTPEQTQAFIAENFPAIAASAASLPAALQRFAGLTTAIADNIDEFRDASRPTLQPIAWTVIAGGIATLLLAGFSLMTNQAALVAAEARRTGRIRRAA